MKNTAQEEHQSFPYEVTPVGPRIKKYASAAHSREEDTNDHQA
jgi:hypothetical protein